MKIDITAEQKTILENLLQTFLHGTTVWAFGSRVKFTSRPASDLDLAAFIQPEQKTNLYALKEALEESDLPFRVEVHNWDNLSENFKMNIEKEYVVVQEANTINNWKPYKLSEIINLIGGGTPKTNVAEYWNGNIPWLSVVDFGNDQKHVFTTEKTITEKGLKESSTKILKKGQLIISARGTVGELAVLGKDMAFNQSCYGITANCKTENDFLYYLLKHSIQRIKKHTHGAVFDTITKQTFDNINVEIPEFLSTQQSIASILSSLDDKIELNLQMNQTLETMAQAIFKEWFVDFNFPGFDGELIDGLPKGWKMGTLGEMIEFKNGKTSPVRNDKGSNPVYGANGIIGFTEDYNTQENVTIIGRVGSFCGSTYFSQTKSWVTDNAIIAKPKINSSVFIFIRLTSLNLNSFRAGSGQPLINQSILSEIVSIIPDNNFFTMFETHLLELYEKIELNKKENQTLTQLRDSLLPKLLTGKISLNL